MHRCVPHGALDCVNVMAHWHRGVSLDYVLLALLVAEPHQLHEYQAIPDCLVHIRMIVHQADVHLVTLSYSSHLANVAACNYQVGIGYCDCCYCCERPSHHGQPS